ncbi:hypothetical protein BWZ20_01365 [Winogradskyella sp. J14-2]|uniref:DUF3822 family protein n=1 Tax=Winogradskyella sp. J14-2 TaxID=1936080 RepID=UPI0009727C98|nr:DUF3822 family protein [Winogradskyella sp. J14-2]APY07029.1 hypothetical protein BWZ20_01365 [Winogradskyella sp. J14-2]
MNKNNIKELSIQVNLNGLSFCILNRTINTIEYLNKIAFSAKLNPFDVLNRLKTELSANSVFSDTFDAVTIIHQNELSTLVPKALYDESNKADYLKFNTKILKTDYITHDDVAVNKSINVYIPYININNYIFETFGEFTYKHSSTVLLDAVLQKAGESHNTEVYLHVNKTMIEITVVENKKLQLFNVFEYHSKEDFIYYVLFVFEQLNLDVETTVLQISGTIDKNDKLYHLLYTYIRHVEFERNNFNFKYSENIVTSKLHHYHLILNTF